MTTPYDPQYGTQQGGPGYGAPEGGPGYGTQPGGQPYGTPPGGPGYGAPPGGPGYGTQPGGQPYGTPPDGPGYGQPGQPGMPGADPYAGAQTGMPGAGAYGGAQTGYPGYQQPGQSGFAAVNQLPGQPLAVIARKRAIKMTLIGAVIFVIGLVITIATYSAASSGGGTYVVAWGPMIVGLIWTIRGLMSLSRASKL